MLIRERPQVKSRIVVDHTSYKTHCDDLVYLKDDTPKYSTDSVQAGITENDLMMCNKDVMGYCLKHNKWAVFDIDSISNISFDSEAFDALMFPKEQKRQILSLVRVHEDERLIFDDFVKGKGRRMVFLLYGDPGTGKTLTAERKSKNLTYNGLVSVFLRILEYYQGILFLTTNRINSFDRAFMSRIHLVLHYPPLTHHSRRTLRYLFLKRASPESAEALLQTGAIDMFAGEKLNGRQIKNVVRTASALALSSDSSADGRISPEYIEWALQPMKQFASYMAGVFQREEEAKRNHHHREESVAVEDKQHELDDDDDDDEADDFDAPLVKRRRLEL